VISRIWHGWASPQSADTYERLLRTQILPGIAAKRIPGYQGVHLLRRDHGNEIEFITVMWFESLDAVRAFQGDDYEVAYVPPEAQAVLSRWDTRSQHYEVLVEPTP